MHLVREVLRKVTATLFIEDTIEKAIADLKSKKIDEKIIYFYVIDDKDKLVGIVSTRKLLLSDYEAKVRDIMDREVVSIREDQTFREAMKLFAKKNLLAIPVVDDKNKLLGAIDVDFFIEESLDVADAQRRTDIFQFIGLKLEEKASLLANYKIRMPWIFCNIASGIICAIISHMHGMVLKNVILIALFIPLVLTLSESVAMQSMTQSMQFFKSSRVSWKYAFLKAFREWKLIGLIACSAGFVVSLSAIFFKQGLLPSFTIGIGIVSSIFISASFGVLMPIVLHKTNLDPKVASGPIVLMFTDIMTTAIYLSLASWWLL